MYNFFKFKRKSRTVKPGSYLSACGCPRPQSANEKTQKNFYNCGPKFEIKNLFNFNVHNCQPIFLIMNVLCINSRSLQNFNLKLFLSSLFLKDTISNRNSSIYMYSFSFLNLEHIYKCLCLFMITILTKQKILSYYFIIGLKTKKE